MDFGQKVKYLLEQNKLMISKPAFYGFNPFLKKIF